MESQKRSFEQTPLTQMLGHQSRKLSKQRLGELSSSKDLAQGSGPIRKQVYVNTPSKERLQNTLERYKRMNVSVSPFASSNN